MANIKLSSGCSIFAFRQFFSLEFKSDNLKEYLLKAFLEFIIKYLLSCSIILIKL